MLVSVARRVSAAAAAAAAATPTAARVTQIQQQQQQQKTAPKPSDDADDRDASDSDDGDDGEQRPAKAVVPPLADHVVLLSRNAPSLLSDPSTALVYTGSLERWVTRLKTTSFSTLAASMVVVPAAALSIDFSQSSLPPTARFILPTSVLAVGALTTSAFQWFVKPYITRMHYNEAQGLVVAETRSFFNTRRYSVFKVSDMRPNDAFAALASFDVGKVPFFVHKEGHKNQKLLRAMAQRAPDITSNEM
jgi:hypothetical protein